MNKITLIGILTRDPEHTTTNNGTAVCKFGIAVKRQFADASGEKVTDFFNIVTWRGLADTCAKWLEKGKKVAVVGSLQIRNYEAKDGSKRQAVEVHADEVEFLSPNEKAKEKTQEPDLEPIDDDTLPF